MVDDVGVVPIPAPAPELKAALTPTTTLEQTPPADGVLRKPTVFDETTKYVIPPVIFAQTHWDSFAIDDSEYPDGCRRCLAVLRTVCSLPQSGEFLWPILPKEAPGYYEKVLHPMVLKDIGVRTTRRAKAGVADAIIVREFQVSERTSRKWLQLPPHPKTKTKTNIYSTQFRLARSAQRDFRTVVANTYICNNVGSITCNNVEKVGAVFDRLVHDWVLNYGAIRPYEWLDDDLCVNPNDIDSKKDSTILLCDNCDAKYNMMR